MQNVRFFLKWYNQQISQRLPPKMDGLSQIHLYRMYKAETGRTHMPKAKRQSRFVQGQLKLKDLNWEATQMVSNL